MTGKGRLPSLRRSQRFLDGVLQLGVPVLLATAASICYGGAVDAIGALHSDGGHAGMTAEEGQAFAAAFARFAIDPVVIEETAVVRCGAGEDASAIAGLGAEWQRHYFKGCAHGSTTIVVAAWCKLTSDGCAPSSNEIVISFK